VIQRPPQGGLFCLGGHAEYSDTNRTNIGFEVLHKGLTRHCTKVSPGLAAVCNQVLPRGCGRPAGGDTVGLPATGMVGLPAMGAVGLPAMGMVGLLARGMVSLPATGMVSLPATGAVSGLDGGCGQPADQRSNQGCTKCLTQTVPKV